MIALPRWRIVGRGVGFGLVPILVLGVSASFYRGRSESYDDYRAGRDAWVGKIDPDLPGILAANASLRDEIDQKTRLVFQRGGAAAANNMFWALIDRRLTEAAGDTAIRACHAAWTGIYVELQSQPRLCRLFGARDSSLLPQGKAAPQIAQVSAACDQAIVDGAKHQSQPPPLLYGAQYKAVSDEATKLPEAFTPAERDAWNQSPGASDEAACAMQIKFQHNVEALDSAMGASFMRSLYGVYGNVVWLDMEPPAPLPPAPESELQCAPAGTRFVLNTFLNDGRSNVWTSLGRHGFDCAILNAATGHQRGLFETLNEDLSASNRPNRMRALWPLAVGKQLEYHFVPVDGDASSEKVRVVSRGRYDMPFGSVDAFAIKRDVHEGKYHYTVTEYWSDEVGFFISRDVRPITGGIPPLAGQDFQLMAKLPPVARL